MLVWRNGAGAGSSDLLIGPSLICHSSQEWGNPAPLYVELDTVARRLQI
jgi:hypothetical protein